MAHRQASLCRRHAFNSKKQCLTVAAGATPEGRAPPERPSSRPPPTRPAAAQSARWHAVPARARPAGWRCCPTPRGGAPRSCWSWRVCRRGRRTACASVAISPRGGARTWAGDGAQPAHAAPAAWAPSHTQAAQSSACASLQTTTAPGDSAGSQDEEGRHVHVVRQRAPQPVLPDAQQRESGEGPRLAPLLRDAA